MLAIADLVVTHNVLRDRDLLGGLVAIAATGGIFGGVFDGFAYGPIAVDVLDGVPYVRNGHHRLAAVHLAGRDHLDPREYHERPGRVADYLHAHPRAGWVTPFDPRSHCRRPDFAGLRRHALRLFDHDPATFHHWIGLPGILDLYAEPRTIRTVGELVARSGWGDGADGSDCPAKDPRMQGP